MLRQSMVHNQLGIEGIQPPPINVLPGTIAVASQPAAVSRLAAPGVVRTPLGTTRPTILAAGASGYTVNNQTMVCLRYIIAV